MRATSLPTGSRDAGPALLARPARRFSNSTLLGYVHWLALLPGLFFLRGFLARTYGKVMVIGLLAFYFVASTTMLIGVDLVIKNFRYMMTLLPFLVVIAAAACGSTYAIIRKKLLD